MMTATTLRDSLTGERWCFSPADQPPEQCAQCGEAIPDGQAFFRFGDDPEAGGDTCCTDCASGCGWLDASHAAAPDAPVLESAWIALAPFHDGALRIVVGAPRALAASAVHQRDSGLAEGIKS